MNSYTIDEPQSETVVSADEWLTYGVGIAVLLLVSVTAISLILILKCIQGRRREKDKGKKNIVPFISSYCCY